MSSPRSLQQPFLTPAEQQQFNYVVNMPAQQPVAVASESKVRGCIRNNWTGLLFLIGIGSMVYMGLRIMNAYADGDAMRLAFENDALPGTNNTCLDLYPRRQGSPIQEPLCEYRSNDTMITACKELVTTICDGRQDYVTMAVGFVSFLALMSWAVLRKPGAETVQLYRQTAAPNPALFQSAASHRVVHEAKSAGVTSITPSVPGAPASRPPGLTMTLSAD